MTQSTIELHAQPRTLMRNASKRLRFQGMIPAQCYGHCTDPQPLQVRASDFQKAYRSAGESTLVMLAVEGGQTLPVLIHDVQHDPVAGHVQHVDFYRVNLNEKVNADVPLVFRGESKAVKESGGILVKTIDHVPVECLPADLPHELAVDIGTLATFDDAITIADIALTSGVVILVRPEEVVATVQQPMSEEELKKLEEKPVEQVELVEVLTKKPQADEQTSTSSTRKEGPAS